MEAIGFLNMIPQMQGMGALSNAEGSKLAAAYSKLSNTVISEKEYKEELKRLKDGLQLCRGFRLSTWSPSLQKTKMAWPQGHNIHGLVPRLVRTILGEYSYTTLPAKPNTRPSIR